MVSLVDFQTSYNAMSEFFRVGVTISTSKTPSVPVPNNWNAKSKNSVIWGRCYGFRV